MKKLLISIMVLQLSVSAFATNYYVSITGNDANSGSQASPWRTISKALSSIPASQGHSLYIGAGTFVETAMMSIPIGVNVYGESAATTKIQSVVNIAMQLMGNGMTGTNKQTISGFSLNGMSKLSAVWGLNIENTHGVNLNNIEVMNFDAMGIRLHGLAYSEVGFIKMSECSRGWADNELRVGVNVPSWAILGCAGDFGVGNLDHVVIHDLDITESEACAVKVSTYGIWGNSAVYLKDVEFYNMDLKVTASWCSKWGKIAFELFDTDNFNVKVHHSRFTTVCSIIPVNQYNFPNKGIEFYNNHFDIFKYENNYAFECEHDNMVIHHNYFEGGLYPFSLVKRNPVKGLSVHHNVFYDQNSPVGLVSIESGVESGVFANNTVVFTDNMWDNFTLFNLDPTYNSKLRVANNVFIKNTNKASKFNVGVVGTVEYNLFQGLDAYGINTFTGNPQFDLGLVGLQRFTPGNTATVQDKGVIIAGITDGFVGSAPDLGAFELGQPVFEYGVGAQTFFIIPNLIEAERAQLLGGTGFNSDHTGYSGTGFVDGYKALGSITTFNLTATQASNFAVTLTFSNGLPNATSLSLFLNGVKVKQIALPSTDTWDTWTNRTDTLAMKNGTNKLEYVLGTADGGHVNLDKIEVVKILPTFTIPATIEAENAELLNGVSINSNHLNFSGTGFADNYQLPGGRTLFRVNAANAGDYSFKLFYANALVSSSLSVYVNGAKIQKTILPVSGTSWDAWASVTETLKLKKGVNTVEYVFDVGDVGLVNLDKVVVEVSTITAYKSEQIEFITKVYPNPFTSTIHISQKQAWQLYNNLGQLIAEGNSDLIDATSFENGFYVLKLANNSAVKLCK